MTPEQERALAIARARKRKAEASGQAPAQAAPASPFLQKGMNMVSGAQATPEPRPVSRMEAASLGAQRGGSFATADEAEGVRNALNMIPQAPGPIGSLTNFGMGLGGMAMEAMTDNLPQSYTQGRDALRAKEQEAQAQHPVTFTGSEIGANIVIPVGGTARAATKVGQVAKGITAGAVSGGAYGFAAENGNLEERAKAGATGGLVGGAFGGILSAVIPRDIPLSDVLNTELFGTKVSRPVLKTIERMLVDAGVPPNRVEAGVVNIRQRLQSGDVGTGLPSRFKDELVKEFGDSARGVTKAIENQIRGGAARSGSASDTAVARVVNEDNAAARELFSRSVDQFAGSTSRPELRGQAIGQLEQIVEQRYKPILAAGIADPAKQQALVGVLNQPRMQSLAKELAEDAEREGIDLAALVARNPAEAAHWMQSKARQLADDRGKVSITGRVIPDRTMSNRRQDILTALEDAVPGYRETRMEYGDKFGVMQAMNFAKGFLNRAKDDVAVADMAEEFAEMSEAQKQMAVASLRSVVTGSAENTRYVDPELGTAALRTDGIGKEPVLKALSEVFGEQGTRLADDIKAIVSRTDSNRRINPQATGSDTMGKAEAIKFAMRNTRGPVQRFVGNMLGGAPMDMLGSAFTGGPTPISAARAGIEGAGQMADNRAMSTVDRVTELLLSQPQGTRAQNALAPPGAPPTGGGAPSGGGQIIDQLSQANVQAQIMWPTDIVKMNPDGTATFRPGSEGAKMAGQASAPTNALSGLRSNEAGFVSYPVTNTLLGGSGGATYGSFNDVNQDGKVNWEDQVGGAMIGVAGMAGVQKGGDIIAPRIPKGYVDRLNATKTISEAADVIAKERFKPAKRMERGATEADWEGAVTEASDALRQEAKRQGGGNVAAEMVPGSLTDPNGKPLVVFEELAAKILRSKGIDPDPVYRPMLDERGTNAQNAKFSKALSYEVGQAKAREREGVDLDQMDDTDAAIEYMSRLNTKDIKPNSPAANALQQIAFGSLGGSAYGSQNDVNRDGVIDEQDAYAGALVGGVGLPLAAGGLGKVGKPRNALADTATAGFGGGGRKPPAVPGETFAGMAPEEALRVGNAPKVVADLVADIQKRAAKAFAKGKFSRDATEADLERVADEIIYDAGRSYISRNYVRQGPETYSVMKQAEDYLGTLILPEQAPWVDRSNAFSVWKALALQELAAKGLDPRPLMRELSIPDPLAGVRKSKPLPKKSLFGPEAVRIIQDKAEETRRVATDELPPIKANGFGGGGRGPRKPKPDSPEAIAAEVRKLAKPKPEPTRLEQMVEAGKDASVPPINTMPRQADALGAQAERMAARGLSPIEIYDQTGVAMIPYNGGSVPIVSAKMGPEELTRVFYSWLKEPPAKRPEWVKKIIDQAPRKKGLLLTDRERIAAPPQANALAEQPLPPERFPAGAVALGTAAGIATGVPAGALAGYAMTRDQQRPRNALSGR